jgi:hypothetical protein
MMSGTMSCRGGDPAGAALSGPTPPEPVLDGAGLPDALPAADAHGSPPLATRPPAPGRLTDVPAESTLLPPASPAPGPFPDVAGAAPVSALPAGAAPLVAAIAAATAMLTVTAPTPMTTGSDARRMVTRLTVPQL